MKLNPRFRFLIVVLLALTSDGYFAATASENTNSLPKYKIDGVFGDWKGYQTGWEETGLDWSKVEMTPPFDGVDLKEFYYDNDDTYLYIFIKCKPTVQERYEKTHSTGALGYLYIDSDLSTNTGATDRDAGGMSTVPGAEIQIYLPTGFSISDGKNSGCLLIYDMKGWNASSKLFDRQIRTVESRDSNSLVAHGKDGVEIALLLSDLRLRKGSKFSLACQENMAFRDDINSTTIQLK